MKFEVLQHMPHAIFPGIQSDVEIATHNYSYLMPI